MIDKYKAQPMRLRCADFLNRKDLGKMKRSMQLHAPAFNRYYD